jgi:hypothetical protein
MTVPEGSRKKTLPRRRAGRTDCAQCLVDTNASLAKFAGKMRFFMLGSRTIRVK